MRAWPLLLCLISPSTAFAQDEPLASQAVSGRDVSDPRRQGGDQLVAAERELELGSDLVFVTTRGELVGVPELFFTDLALWRVQVAGTPTGGLRISAGSSFLAKQPSRLDEDFWQSSELGARLAVGKGMAVGLDGQFGTLMDDLGHHAGAALTFQARKRMNELVHWQTRLGVAGTQLYFDDDSPTFVEAAAQAQVQFCWGPCHYRYGATWFGVSLAVPLHHSDDAIDPNTRLDATLGTYFNVNNRFDMLLTLSWIDRGDADAPETQLPIVDGGFDQVQLGFGVLAHFGGK
jgi:hypothetical protein